MASGRVTLLEKEDEVKASTLLHPDTIVMKHQSDSSVVPSPIPPLHIEMIEQELKRNKKRIIPESDIGLAVVYCSTERYCNPSYSLGNNLFSLNNLRSQTLTQGDVYIEETQSTQSSNRSKTKYGSFVEESLERAHPGSLQNSTRETPSRKRVREEEIKGESSSKHLKLPEANESDLFKTIASTSTVPISPETELPADIKVENSPVHSPSAYSPPAYSPPCSLPDHDEDDDSIENAQTQVWEDIPDHIPDGFISKPKKENSIVTKPKSSDSCEELPSKLVNVEYAALCPLRNNRPTRINARDKTELNGFVRNFKKFRKIYSAVNGLPRIIGGRDLVAHDRNAPRALDEWLSQNPETEPEREEAGLFDWEARPRARRR